jgi:thioredoxin 1
MPAMVEFWAEWCKPCELLAPVIEELAGKYQNKIKIVQMNVDDNIETPLRFGIRNIPALILFKRGQVKQIIVGYHPKNRIENELEKLL